MSRVVPTVTPSDDFTPSGGKSIRTPCNRRSLYRRGPKSHSSKSFIYRFVGYSGPMTTTSTSFSRGFYRRYNKGRRRLPVSRGVPVNPPMSHDKYRGVTGPSGSFSRDGVLRSSVSPGQEDRCGGRETPSSERTMRSGMFMVESSIELISIRVLI